MNECDVCYDLFDYEPNVYRFDVGKYYKTPLIITMCKQCGDEYNKLYKLRASQADVDKHPIKIRSDQAIHQKVALSRKSIL